MSPSKQRILERIRQAAQERTPKPYPDIKDAASVFPPIQDDLAVVFARSFVQAGGFFHYAESPEELAEHMRILCESKGWNHLYCWDKRLQDLLIDADFRYVRIGRNLDKADGAITDCEALLARTGSVLLSSKQAAGRTLSAFPHVHVIIATPDDLVEDIRHGFELLENKYGGSAHLPSMICVATGPSRTADIEKTLVLGAHGPKEIHVFLYDHQPTQAAEEE